MAGFGVAVAVMQEFVVLVLVEEFAGSVVEPAAELVAAGPVVLVAAAVSEEIAVAAVGVGAMVLEGAAEAVVGWQVAGPLVGFDGAAAAAAGAW